MTIHSCPHMFSSSQVGKQAGSPLPWDSTAFQEASTVLPNNTPPRKAFPKREAVPPLLTQAARSLRQVTTQFLPRQAGNAFPQDSMASQEASVVPLNSIHSREGSTNSIISQTSSQAVRHSSRLRASQTDSDIPQVDSKVSQASGDSPPSNSTTPRATSNAGPRKQGLFLLLATLLSRQLAGQAEVTGTLN